MDRIRTAFCLTGRAWPWLSVVLGALVLGYCLGRAQSLRTGNLSSRDLDRTELQYVQRSFSDLENTKSELDHLAQEMSWSVQVLLRKPAATNDPSGRHAAAAREQAIRMLKQAIVELAGTDQQGPLTAELLPLLEATGRLDEWVNRYLEIAYHQPSENLLTRRASDALRIGQRIGRLTEIAAALETLDTIPARYRARPAPTITPIPPAELPAAVMPTGSVVSRAFPDLAEPSTPNPASLL